MKKKARAKSSTTADPVPKLKAEIQRLKAENKILRAQQAGYWAAMREWREQMQWVREKVQTIEGLLNADGSETPPPPKAQRARSGVN